MLARCLQYNKMKFICHDLNLRILFKVAGSGIVRKSEKVFVIGDMRLKEIHLHLFSVCVAIFDMNETKQSMKTNQEDQLLFSAKGISKVFDGKTIISNFHMEIHPDERIALMGPSGSGKTTILKIIAGIVEPDQEEVYSTKNVSMVFDGDDLYRELSAFRNIELGVDFSKINKKERKEKVIYWAERFSCLSFLDQVASTLSAGQRKRVALARAMMKEPDILLLDETFHALDPELRQEIMTTLMELLHERHFALVFATHHEEEAKMLDARVIEFEELNCA